MSEPTLEEVAVKALRAFLLYDEMTAEASRCVRLGLRRVHTPQERALALAQTDLLVEQFRAMDSARSKLHIP